MIPKLSEMRQRSQKGKIATEVLEETMHQELLDYMRGEIATALKKAADVGKSYATIVDDYGWEKARALQELIETELKPNGYVVTRHSPYRVTPYYKIDWTVEISQQEREATHEHPAEDR